MNRDQSVPPSVVCSNEEKMAIEWLKRNHEPEEELRSYWRKCSRPRLHELLTTRSLTPIMYIRNWHDILKLPSSYRLVPVAAEFEECRRQRVEKYSSYKTTIQPYIAVVSSEDYAVEEVYAVMHDTPWRMSSVLQAVDICFKMCFVVHCEFQPECAHLWLLIQQALYGFQTPNDQVISTVLEFISGGFLTVLKEKVGDTIPENNAKEKAEIYQMFDSCIQMFDGLHSQHMRIKALEESGAYVKPISFVIGHAEDIHTENGHPVNDTILLEGQYIPISDMLKGFLELPGVFNLVCSYVHELEKDVRKPNPKVSSLIQGKLWQTKIKPKFEGKFVLPLIYGFDAYEPNKELGSHTGSHKLGAGGDRILGNKKCFRKLVAGLIDLDTAGITIVTPEGQFVVHFALVLAVGDNLGANGILGMGFYYGPNEERNRPPSISKDDLLRNKHLKGTASETRCLARYFGLMFGHLVKEEDFPVWNVYLLLRKSIDILNAPILSTADAQYLGEVIRKHHLAYMEVFQLPLQPKFHLALHYEEIIIDSGPPVLGSCYRFEAKHKEGKKVARNSKNRLNLPLTVANRHQLKVASRFLCGRGLVPTFEYTHLARISLFNIKQYSLFHSVVPSEHLADTAWDTVRSLQLNGVIYSVGSVVVTAMHAPNNPVFGEIHTIQIMSNNNANFVLKMYKTLKFDEHVFAYLVEYDDSWSFVNQNQLITYVATERRILSDGKWYVPFRFSLQCLLENQYFE
ncbi:hypothetical protein ONE63_011437 [Megalurothrips usitatus]|uniref:Uncharacterized protein n=1 Tax=Megalurothrips usitatus TaxID=439358 RepID=A0AAV7WZB1_9NEOP|nr:hypothetical protein ONE63_011437 [Megalurothrips usitatus]